MNFVNLPDYYTPLLRANVNIKSNFYEELKSYVLACPPLNAITKNDFLDIDSRGDYNSILKSLGWTGYRNKLASIFISKLLNGNFPESSDLAYIQDVIDFELAFSKYTVEGYSRLFLLGFYLKLAQREKDSNWSEFIPRCLGQYLKKTKSKVVKIDWIIIILSHLHTYLGEDEVFNALEESKDWFSLFSQLTVEQKEEFLENALAYGASIGEKEAFCGMVME